MLKSFFKCSCGYTFVELLLAITILGIVVSPFIALFSGSYLAINNAGRHTVAANLCRDRLESLKSSGFDSVYELYINSDGNAVIENDLLGHSGFRRSTLIQPYPVEHLINSNDNNLPETELLLIEVTVSWSFREVIYEESVVTLLGSW